MSAKSRAEQATTPPPDWRRSKPRWTWPTSRFVTTRDVGQVAGGGGRRPTAGRQQDERQNPKPDQDLLPSYDRTDRTYSPATTGPTGPTPQLRQTVPGRSRPVGRWGFLARPRPSRVRQRARSPVGRQPIP